MRRPFTQQKQERKNSGLDGPDDDFEMVGDKPKKQPRVPYKKLASQ